MESSHSIWIIYGAGRIGSALCRAAVAAGHPVIIAGREGRSHLALADSLGIDHMTFPLDMLEARRFSGTFYGVKGLFNTAGPFTSTTPALIELCVRNGMNYADMSNEMSSHAVAWRASTRAIEAGVAIVPGAGFGTAASERLAVHAVNSFTTVRELAIILPLGVGSTRTSGVKSSAKVVLAEPPNESRAGRLHRVPSHGRLPSIELPDGRATVAPITNGDLEALRRTSNIARIQVCTRVDLPPWAARIALPVARARARGVARLHRLERPQQASSPSDEATTVNLSSKSTLYARLLLEDKTTRIIDLTVVDRQQFSLFTALRVMRELESDSRNGTHTTGQILNETLPSDQLFEITVH